MSSRIFLHLGDATHKCFFATVQCSRPNLQTPLYRQIRNLRNSRNFFKEANSSFPNVHMSGTIQPARLWKQLGFAVTFSAASLVGAAIWEYERIRSQTYSFIQRYKQFQINRTGWRGEIQTWWRNLTEGQRIFVPICFVNVVVYLAWRVPTLQKTMLRYFCANPASNVSCWPMILSVFSHYSVLHLAANMYVLHSFSTIAVSTLGREQFLALYLSGGVISSLASHAYKTMFRLPGFSLGASGAILGVLGFVCTQYPDINVGIILLPITFTAGVALKAIMAIDVAGCIMGWKYFDHAAHLGGVLFGIFWQTWGNANIWQKRGSIHQFWHELREPRRSQ